MCFRERMLAFIIDMVVMFAIVFIISIPVIYDDYFLLDDNLSRSFYVIYSIGLIIIALAWLLKELANGQSIGKKTMKIKVVNNKNQKPNVFQLLLRNITFFIWPIEVILLLLGKRRLGDYIAKTNVIYA